VPINREEGTFQPEALCAQVTGARRLGLWPVSVAGPGTHGPHQ